MSRKNTNEDRFDRSNEQQQTSRLVDPPPLGNQDQKQGFDPPVPDKIDTGSTIHENPDPGLPKS